MVSGDDATDSAKNNHSAHPPLVHLLESPDDDSALLFALRHIDGRYPPRYSPWPAGISFMQLL
jgi:hypothetical protein